MGVAVEAAGAGRHRSMQAPATPIPAAAMRGLACHAGPVPPAPSCSTRPTFPLTELSPMISVSRSHCRWAGRHSGRVAGGQGSWQRATGARWSAARRAAHLQLPVIVADVAFDLVACWQVQGRAGQGKGEDQGAGSCRRWRRQKHAGTCEGGQAGTAGLLQQWGAGEDRWGRHNRAHPPTGCRQRESPGTVAIRQGGTLNRGQLGNWHTKLSEGTAAATGQQCWQLLLPAGGAGAGIGGTCLLGLAAGVDPRGGIEASGGWGLRRAT